MTVQIVLTKLMVLNPWFAGMVHVLSEVMKQHGDLFVTGLLGVILLISIAGIHSEVVLSALLFQVEPGQTSKSQYRSLSYGFVHVGYWHLIGNVMAAHSFFTLLLTKVFFDLAFLIFLLGIVIPGMLTRVMPSLAGGARSIVGCSGGVMALIGATAVLIPDSILTVAFAGRLAMGNGALGLLLISIGLALARILPSVWHQGHAMGVIVGYVCGYLVL